MRGSAVAARLDRSTLARLADALVVAVAFALPWSTTATGILLVLWLVALIPSLEWPDMRRELLTPAGGLPVLLFGLGALGMLWAEVDWSARWAGLDAFWKLLAIPLLMTQFRRSDQGHRVFSAFLAACILLLIASVVVLIWPHLPRGSTDGGVAVKSYIVQSIEFTMAAAGLLYLAFDQWSAGRRAVAAGLALLASAFLLDIFFVATARTTLVVIPALALVYGAWRFGGRGTVVAGVLVVVLAALVWQSSSYVRDRVSAVFTAMERHDDPRNVTPSEQRLVYWSKSLDFIGNAPVFGHGTGSIKQVFAQSAVGETGARGEAADNPHNQTFAVGIQLGVVGMLALWAMWLSHFALFRGSGFVAWIGLVVVTQNVVGSLFNSFLFDYTEGWLYVVGFGVTAGMIRRQITETGKSPSAHPVRAP